MNTEAIASRYPLPPDAYNPYINPTMKPRLDSMNIETKLLFGASRLTLRTPTTGDASIVVLYKHKEGMVSSFGLTDTDLRLLQIQGANSCKSYRVVTGMYGEIFFADESVAMVTHPESGLSRIVVPQLTKIEGIEGAESEHAITRYRGFIHRAALAWSDEESAYIRDFVSGSSGTIYNRKS